MLKGNEEFVKPGWLGWYDYYNQNLGSQWKKSSSVANVI